MLVAAGVAGPCYEIRDHALELAQVLGDLVEAGAAGHVRLDGTGVHAEHAGVLLAKLPEDTQPDVGYELNRLSEFAGILRYEEGHTVYSSDDIEEARSLVEEVLTWARGAAG